MLFCSMDFLYFMTIVLVLYWAMPWAQARVWLLLVASFVFYACFNKWLALLICVSTLMDYAIALSMEATAVAWRRRGLLLLSLVANLGLLCYFKYANFFLTSIYDALGWAHDSSHPLLDIILPVGISFYTFEAINYTVDVYRRKVPAERNLGHFMLFITFFPHLVAGPIVRARDFLPQVKRPKHWRWGRFHIGAQFFLMGLFKKLAIANRMALYADPVFAEPEKYGSLVAWLAVVAYAVQVYCDFSGYTDMAIGAAHMLGYKLAQNFNMPYLACNVSEFWRRWHISLSSWLRDYVFIPLGGSRGGEWKTRRNLLITMSLGGLWHGAAWTYVAWGVLHGVLLVVHRAFQDLCKTRPRLDALLQTAPGTLLRVATTFLAICVGLVFFRSTSFSIVGRMFGQMMYAPPGLASEPIPSAGIALLLAIVICCHLAGRRTLWERWHVRLPAPVLGFGYAVALTMALLLAPGGSQPFIYFQF
jgi:alginate O-acetyltransferase complex protein AlgI